MRTVFLLLMLLMVTLVQAQGKVYKWVDENGKTRYTDKTPESENIKSEEVKIAPPPPVSNTYRPSWQEQAQEVDRRLNQKQEEARNMPSSEQLCASARRQVAMLGGGRLARINDKGERVFMGDDEIASLQTEAAQAIAANCPP